MSGNNSDSSIGLVDDATPKPSKGKNQNKKRLAEYGGDDEGKSSKKPKRQTNSEGSEMIPLGKNKFVTVREFRGKVLIDFREYYEKDGKMLPGKKGISLSRDQFLDLKSILPEIDEKINEF